MVDPSKTLQQILQPGDLKKSLFSPTSRYYGVDMATLETDEGRVIMYVRRRFCPPPERFALLQEHMVTGGERPDTLTAQYLGDPEQFWRICDSNAILRPEDLTETVGRKVRITLPEGIPGVPNA